jgi:hypothetical protein
VRAFAAILAGAALLAWPALLNGYPLVFSDTGGFLHQTTGPLMLWDKPWIYGPLLHLFHWRVTLWLPLAAQALLASHLLWLLQRVLRGDATAPAHLGTCILAASLTTAPFTVALLMPDVFAPAVVMALALLGFAHRALSRGESAWLVLLATVGIAAHLSHLPLALAMAAIALLAGRWRGALLAAMPLLPAVALLLATNAVGHGRAAVSPNGATFMLARLQADGPAAAVIRARCPAAGWYLCAFADRLPMDANAFLWAPDSPVNRDAAGNLRFLGGALLAREAGEIVAATLRAHPLEVARAMLRNSVTQLMTAGIGDTLGNEHLEAALRPRIAEAFPARELAAFDASDQARGALRDTLGSFGAQHGPALILALAALGVALRWRGGGLRAWIVVAVLAGVVANAVATGGLSGVFPRYQARVAWLLPVLAMILLLPVRRRPA